MPDCLVLGIGNPDRGDDGVGRLVARSVRARAPAGVRIAERDGEATAVLAELEHATCAWIIDAAKSGATPGTIHRVDCVASDIPLPGGAVSSHGFGLADAIALARTLGMLPEHCIVYAVEAAEFGSGARLTVEVAAAAEEVARRIVEEIEAHA